MKEQLTKQELSAYLPWEVKVSNSINLAEFGVCQNTIELLEGYNLGNVITDKDEFGIEYCMLYLFPRSHLTKEIEHKGEKFVPMRKILKEVGFNYPQECYDQDESWILNDGYRALSEFPYRKIQLLLELHFDVFGLIERGLAIDKTTL